YNGKKVDDYSTLPVLVAATSVGKTVPVEIVRNGRNRTLEVTVSRLAEQEAAAAEPPAQKSKWGLALRDPRPEEREQLGLKKGEGVVVENVLPDSPAAEAGVQSGDVILQANQTAVGSVAELIKEVG